MVSSLAAARLTWSFGGSPERNLDDGLAFVAQRQHSVVDATSTIRESDRFRMTLIDRITEFLSGIGLPCRSGEVTETTFVPGIIIDHGSLVFDFDKLTYPGDLLHEAGHLAVMPPERRRKANRTVGKFVAEELMAIAWSYAAAVHLQIDPAVVFHPDGYKGGSQSLIENFSQGHFIAVPTLQWLGMTADEKRARELGIRPYPAMIQWINEGPNGCYFPRRQEEADVVRDEAEQSSNLAVSHTD